MTAISKNEVDAVLERGLRELWYPICPSSFIEDRPVSMWRLGYKIVLWRDANKNVHALEDRCPHRGAPLSLGVNLGDRLACPYHGVEVRCDGVVTRVQAVFGVTADPSQVLVEIADPTAVDILFSVAPAQAGLLHRGAKIALSAGQLPRTKVFTRAAEASQLFQRL